MSRNYQKIRIDRNGPIAEIVLNRPTKMNIMDMDFFDELGLAYQEVDQDPEIRVVIVWAEGKMFTAGLDLKSSASVLMGSEGESSASRGIKLHKHVKHLQECVRGANKCKKPVIAAIHGACIGGGVDLVSWCDIRLATSDASFSIKETQIAIVADLGTLQRIGKITSKGFSRELAFTGEAVSADRCLRFGFVNEVYKSKDEMLSAARKMASTITSNSPLVVQGTKITLEYADEHNTEDALNQIALWNSAFLHSEDLIEATSAFFEKRKPVFKCKL